MVNEKIRMPPVFVIAGFLTLIAFLIMFFTVTSLDTSWKFGEYTLSSLGHSENDNARTIFNYGCVLIGLLGFIFGCGLIKRERNWLYLSGILAAICGVCLMGVGAMPDSYNPPHEVIAKMFGLFSALAMIVAAIGDWYNGRRIYAIIPIALLLLCAVMLAMKEYGLFEFISVMCILVWMVTQSYKYLRLDGMVEYDNPLYMLTKRNDQ